MLFRYGANLQFCLLTEFEINMLAWALCSYIVRVDWYLLVSQGIMTSHRHKVVVLDHEGDNTESSEREMVWVFC